MTMTIYTKIFSFSFLWCLGCYTIFWLVNSFIHLLHTKVVQLSGLIFQTIFTLKFDHSLINHIWPTHPTKSWWIYSPSPCNIIFMYVVSPTYFALHWNVAGQAGPACYSKGGVSSGEEVPCIVFCFFAHKQPVTSINITH